MTENENTFEGATQEGAVQTPQKEVEQSTNRPEETHEGRNIHRSEESAGSSVRRSGGPRTPAGKARTKYNALKSGRFAKVAVIETPFYKEPKRDYGRLLRELQKEWQPVGFTETLQVEEIAFQLWRLLRVRRAEQGYILERHIPVSKDDPMSDQLLGLLHTQTKTAPSEDNQALKAECARIGRLKKSTPHFDDSEWLQATEKQIMREYYRALDTLRSLQRGRLGSAEGTDRC